MKKEALFAKQPLFDANNNLFGFEILYRNTEVNLAIIKDDSEATTDVIINYCSGLIDEAVGPYVKLFINLSRELILSDRFFPLPPERLVIEILADTQVDIDFLVKLSGLISRGYSFALDNYKFDPRFDDLLSLVDYVKLDVVGLNAEDILSNYNQLIKKLAAIGRSRTIIVAGKIETKEIRDICHRLGFSLFQGYFLAWPKIVFGKKLESSSQNALRLVTALQQPDITMDEVSNLVSQDVRQSYMILKIVNSPIFRFPRKIESIREGVTFLGLKQIKRWAMVFALTGNSNVPVELFRILLERAKTCELYSKQMAIAEPEISFTVGLFSGLDLVLQADKSWLLTQLDLSQDLLVAILKFEGRLGSMLENVIELEKGQLGNLEKLELENKQSLMEANFEASIWANNLFPMLKSVEG